MDGTGIDVLDNESRMLEMIRNLEEPAPDTPDDFNFELGSTSLVDHDSERRDDSDSGFVVVSNDRDTTAESTGEAPGIVLGRERYNRALQGALINTTGLSSSLQQPWEKGPMKMIFQDSLQLSFSCSMPTSICEPIVDNTETSGEHDTVQHIDKKKKVCEKQPSFAYCVKCKPDTSYLDKTNALIQMAPHSFQLGRVVVDENELPEDRLDALVETVEVVLSMKSPNTVNKRAGSLLLYVKWFSDCERGEPFPISEKDVAAYLFHLRRSGSFISRGASFREALRFAHYVLGLDGAIEACDSPRIRGAADSMLCKGGTWSPADPLMVSEVLRFHNILDANDEPLLDRIAAGNILAVVYGRCRASDLAFIKSVKLDYGPDNGYLELGTQHHKSSRKATLKRKLLPIVIPVIGINKKNWADTLLGLRKAAGLRTDDLNNEPWWPAPIEVEGDSIKWGNRPVSSEEISDWMVATLKTSGDKRKISSHSAKVTCLSWLSKAGVPREDRDVLGRHVTMLHGAGPLYARELIAAPFRKLENTIEQVASKVFLPGQKQVRNVHTCCELKCSCDTSHE